MLFVLHPIETFGFGVGWIAVIAAASVLGHSLSALAIVVFAGINLLFGTLGHTGVDPVPERWKQLRIFRYVATPIFHAQHHLDPGVNFGFFTVIWDRWFRTTDPTYTYGR